MLFGKDKKKEGNSTRPVQYTQPAQAHPSRSIGSYSRQVPHASNIARYPPTAQQYDQHDTRARKGTARPPPSAASSSSSPWPPYQPSPSQYGQPLSYRPAPRRSGRFVPKTVSPAPEMLQSMKYCDSGVRLLSKKTYERKAQEDAWDRGWTEYVHARDNGLPYAGNSMYGPYVCRGKRGQGLYENKKASERRY